jgi:hypothetical protein
MHQRKLLRNVELKLPDESNKVMFLPLNNSYKKVFANIPEEITHENFGVLKNIRGGLGTRNDLS